MPLISFPYHRQATHTSRPKNAKPEETRQTLFTQQSYDTKAGKRELLIKFIKHNFSNKTYEQIKLFCVQELKAISCIIDAAGNEAIARDKLIKFYNDTNPSEQIDHIDGLLNLFRNRNTGFLGQQNLNRSAAIYIQVLRSLPEIDLSALNSQERKNIDIATNESNKWYRENYIRDVQVRKNQDDLEIQLGALAGKANSNSAREIDNNLIVFRHINTSADPTTLNEILKEDNIVHHHHTPINHPSPYILPKQIESRLHYLSKHTENTSYQVFSHFNTRVAPTVFSNYRERLGFSSINLRYIQEEDRHWPEKATLLLLNNVPSPKFFDFLPVLRELIFCSSNIKEIPSSIFQYLKNLQILNFSGNEIEQIEENAFMGLSNLQILNLSANKIKRLEQNAFFGLSKLVVLDLASNDVEFMHFKAFKGLDNLVILKNNIFKGFPFDLLDNLQIIIEGPNFNTRTKLINTIVENKRRQIWDNIAIERYLQELASETNFFEYLKELNNTINEQEYRSLDEALKAADYSEKVKQIIREVAKEQLPVLDLSDCELSELPSTQILSFLTCVEKLNLANNQISELKMGGFSILDKLKVLNLRNNQIRVIKSNVFMGLTQLRELDLSRNRIVIIHKHGFNWLLNLNTLVLDYNNLFAIHKKIFNPLANLIELSINNTTIEFITKDAFSGLGKLISLQIKNTPYLTELPQGVFSELDTLSYLYLSHNQNLRIKPGNFDSLRNLKHLDLSRNYMEMIVSGVFDDLNNLQYLDLSWNEFRYIEGSWFNGLLNLEKLYIKQYQYFPITLGKNAFNSLASLKEIEISISNLEIIERLSETILYTGYSFSIDLCDDTFRAQTLNLDAETIVRGLNSNQNVSDYKPFSLNQS